jgi:hypothetical protein
LGLKPEKTPIPGVNKIDVTFAKVRPAKIPIHCHGLAFAAILLLSIPRQLPGQYLTQFTASATRDVPTANAPASLPKTTEEIDSAITRVETRLSEVRLKVSPRKTTEIAEAQALGATPEELVEREQLLQQWVIALDQYGRYLQSLKEIRRLNQERMLEQETWRGFDQRPTILVVEQLTDTVAAQRLEMRTGQMFLSILEGEIARSATRLTQSHKQLRLAQDQAEQGIVQNLRPPLAKTVGAIKRSGQRSRHRSRRDRSAGDVGSAGRAAQTDRIPRTEAGRSPHSSPHRADRPGRRARPDQ